MIALFILTFGLLTTAQLLSAAASAGALARSKATAALATQDQIEHLSALFRRNPEDPEIIPGTHGPRTVEIADASNATVLNRFDLTWEVTELPPVRPGTTLGARQVTVTATPVAAAGAPNLRPRQNKAVAIAGIFSTRFP